MKSKSEAAPQNGRLLLNCMRGLTEGGAHRRTVVLSLLLLLLLATPRGFGQSYGPPYIAYGSNLLTYSTTVTTGSGAPYDLYIDTAYGNAPVFRVHSDGTLTGDPGGWAPSFHGTNYDYTTTAGWGGAFAVGLDSSGIATKFLGVPHGVTILDQALHYSTNSTLPQYFTTSSAGTFYVYGIANGTETVSKYFPTSAQYFSADGSPWYWFNGNLSGGDVIVDGSSTWPASGIFAQDVPQVVYVNNNYYYLYSSTGNTDSGADYVNTYFYAGPLYNQMYSPTTDYVTIQVVAHNGHTVLKSSGASTYSSMYGSIGAGNEIFNTDFNPDTWTSTTGFNTNGTDIPGDMYVSFAYFTGTPSHGPPNISLNSVLLQFYYTTENGTDVYTSLDGLSSVSITTGNSVSVNDNGTGHSGTYGPPFNVPGEPNLVAMDSSGNPLSLPPGILYMFGSGGGGQAIIEGNGTVITPDITFQVPGGMWGAEYFNIATGPYLVASYLLYGGVGNYTSPIYGNVAGTNATMNATSGWPASNVFPGQIYVNGIQCNLYGPSVYDSGGNIPRNGGATYSAPGYDLSVTLSWSWDTQFHGYVTGSFGATSAFTGVWDGASGFTNLTEGIRISTGVGPSYGPPEVLINGTELGFNPSQSGVNNPDGSDVYTANNGQLLVLNQDGTVYYGTPNGTGGTNWVAGNYNATAQQFTFTGSGVSGIALDTSGRILLPNDTVSGGTTAGPVTNIAGGLDILGNVFSLGSWMAGNGDSVYGVELSYTDGSLSPTWVSTLQWNATRSGVQWLWTHDSQEGASGTVNSMALDPTNRLILYNPTSNSPGITLDPSNAAGFHAGLRTPGGGGISMGTFGTGTPP